MVLFLLILPLPELRDILLYSFGLDSSSSSMTSESSLLLANDFLLESLNVL